MYVILLEFYTGFFMIDSLMQNARVCIHFQPIVSVRSSKVIGVEALMRAYDEAGQLLSPLFVFEEAKKEGFSFEFDKFVRKEALQTFSKIYKQDTDLLLFLNFESHLIDEVNDFGVFDFCSIACDLGIPFKNIVLEIKENEISNTQNLTRFCKHFKDRGFLIALDDFGAGNANFDRISQVHPNIVKIDRSLIYNIDKNFINKEILRSIANMCFSIGALVLAEGVESQDEIMRCMKLDIDLFQGFWFARPQAKPYEESILADKLAQIGSAHTQNIKDLLYQKEMLSIGAKEYCYEIIKIFESNEDDQSFVKYLERNPNIEAIYVLESEHGVQISPTYILQGAKEFFKPAQKGESHSLKEYYYITKESKRGSFLSAKYISRASGKMCRTYAQVFDLHGEKSIVCVDLKERLS